MTETTETTTIRVLTARVEECKVEMAKLLKKARRYGNDDLSIEVGPTYIETIEKLDWRGRPKKVETSFNDVVITGGAPRVGNHEFLAHVELGGSMGNIVDSVPGIDATDERFRHADGHCDHCNTSRARRDIYVVRDLDTGEQLQVGRTCLRDYLGIDDPRHIAARFSFFRAIETGGDEEGWGGFGGAYAESVSSLLSLGATAVRLFGWCSRGKARFEDSLTATAYYVALASEARPKPIRNDDSLGQLWDKIHQAHTDADDEMAQATLEWLRSMSEEEATASDYIHNLRVLCLQDGMIYDPRRMGMVISAISAYHRALEKELRETEAKRAAEENPSEWVGEPKERLKGLRVTKDSARVVGGSQWGETVLIKFTDEDGNKYCWFTAGGSGLENGEQAVIDGTVKSHNEFRGVRETQLTRVKVVS